MRFGSTLPHETEVDLRSRGIRRAKDLFYASGLPRSYRRTYSQFGEDTILLQLFDGFAGHYVDVGSGHPVRGSNTFALYRKGWSGVAIDPLKRNIAMAKVRRRRDVNLLGCCGSDGGSRTFYEFEPYEYSTLSLSRVRELQIGGLLPVNSYSVPSFPLKTLELKANPCDPSLLSIDTEGWELEVLRGNDWEMYRPAVVCIEELSSPLHAPTEVQRMLEGHGYQLWSAVGPSSIYCHDEFRSQPAIP